MKAFTLFGRLRRWGSNLVVSIFSGVLIVLVGPLRYSLNPTNGYLIVVVAQLPLLSAVALQASMVSPLRQQEQTAARSLRRLRAVNYVGLSLLGALILGAATSFPSAPTTADPTNAVGAVAVVRNLLALIGAGFIGASLLGPSLGWTVPTGWAILPYLLFTQTAQTHEVLTLVSQPDDSFIAVATAAIVWLLGLLLTVSSRQDIANVPHLILRWAPRVRRR